MASIKIIRFINHGARMWYASFFLTLTRDEMTQSRWHQFNDIEHLVKQVVANMLWKDCLVECVTLFHSHVDMFMHQHILGDNGTLGKIKEYVIRYELQHCGFVMHISYYGLMTMIWIK
jgi:hypothetical protein